MSSTEKPTIGATVVPLSPSTPSHHPVPKPSLESMSTLHQTPSHPTTTQNTDYDPTSTNPFSAFYSHPTTRTSFEQKKSESRTHIQIYEHDLGANASRLTQAEPIISEKKKECTVWPGKDQLLQLKSEAAIGKGRGWHPLRRLSRRQSLWVKVIIAVVIVGAATGLGIGISKATGAGVFRGANAGEVPVGAHS